MNDTKIFKELINFKTMPSKKINLGGQAVIEGVMIRGARNYVVAVRKDRKIITKSSLINKKIYFFLRLPIIRGFINLIDMLKIGLKSLMWSARQASNEEKLGNTGVTFTLFISMSFVILFFVGLPYLLTSLTGLREETKPFLFNITDGLIRILIFLIYLLIVSRMKDVQILFQYHGAEHKAIHCYENGKKLDVSNVGKFTTLHPRCGTSFLLIVFCVSILVFSLLPSIILIYYHNFSNLNVLERKGVLIPARILLIPLIAGVSYEILKISDRGKNNPLLKLISIPGLWIQKITTKEPNKKQLEVALASIKRLIKIETVKNK